MLDPRRLAAGSRWGLFALLLASACAPTTNSTAPLRRPPAAAPVAHVTATSRPSPVASPPAPVPEPTPPRLGTLVDHIAFTPSTRPAIGAPTVGVSSGILVDLDSRQILWAQDEHVRRAPASTSKMMTAIVALQNLPQDWLLTVVPEATRVTEVETRMDFGVGEKLTVNELLRGVLTISANDAAMELGYATVGMPEYVDTMNRQAADLGLADTHYTGPVGYPDDPGQYSSAYDLAVIGSAAYLHYPIFRDMIRTPYVVLPASPTHRQFEMRNINKLLDIYPAALGGKSGYTDAAGPCLVSVASRNGHTLVGVVMHANNLFEQSRTLLEWGFAQEGLPPLPRP